MEIRRVIVEIQVILENLTFNSGSYSEVYLGTNNETNQDYAIKIVTKGNSARNIRLLSEEIQILRILTEHGSKYSLFFY